MSEHEEAVPLTRRERRMRELAETGALNLSDLTAEPAAAVATPEVEEVEISTTNPDGSLRSRREIRELREQALAEREAANSPAESAVVTEPLAEAEDAVEAEVTAEAEDTVDPEAEAAVEPEAEVAVEEVAEVEAEEVSEPEAEVATEPENAVPAEAAELPAEDFDYIISPPTEPFTVEELRAAEAPSKAEDSAEAEESAEAEADVAGDADVTESEAAPETEPQPEASGKSRLKFWKRTKGAEAAEEAAVAPENAEAEVADTEVSDDVAADTVAAEAAAEVVTDEALVASEHIAEDVEVAPEAAETETVESEVAAQPEVEVLPDPVVVEEPVAAPESPKEAYSFPDITPPEEWRSVFDDPATLNLPVQSGEPQGDFDDLISRAVAQEGSTTSTGTSALILPTMPEDTGGLTGPLGATGELFVTGSMRLPKSLGETGGHVSLHDSTEIDPITGAETLEDSGVVAGPAPVSARHAVSARVVSGVPAVAKPTKERSKLPLVLGATGGGLVVVVAGLGIWGATQGFFG